jgi:hypothetical protein
MIYVAQRAGLALNSSILTIISIIRLNQKTRFALNALASPVKALVGQLFNFAGQDLHVILYSSMILQ